MEGTTATNPELSKSPANPREVLSRIIENRAGDQFNIPLFLQDVGRLDKMGVAKRPQVLEYLRHVGQDRAIRETLVKRIIQNNDSANGQKVLEDIRLAQILGLEELPNVSIYLSYLRNKYKPKKRSYLKRNVVLATGAAAIAAASIVGSGAPTAGIGKFLGGLSKGQSTSQEGPSTQSPIKLETKPTATATFPPTPTATSTARPTETPTSEPTRTPEVVKVTKKDLFREIAAPRIYQDVLRIREQRAKKDPEYSKRVNLELNKNKINFLILGLGKEGSLTDTILVVSYDIPSHSVYQIAFPRELQSPEVWQKTKNPGSSQINQTLSVGGARGIDLAKVTMENATSLSMDLGMVVNFDVLVDLIDKTVGYIDVELEKPINDPEYPALKGNGYDPFYISAGKHRLDGATALKVARSRYGSSTYERNERQQKIVLGLFKRLLEEGGQGREKGEALMDNIKMILKQKIQEGTLKTDFDPDMLFPDIWKAIPSMPFYAWNKFFGPGWKLTDEPTFFSTGITNRNFVVGAGIPGISTTKIAGGNPYSDDPRRDYWSSTRKFIGEFFKDNVGAVPPEEEIEIVIPPKEGTTPSSQRLPQTGKVVNVEFKTAPFENVHIGESVERLPIEAVKFGSGKVALTLIGGLHTDDEENTRLLAKELIEYFKKNPQDIPPQISLYIIPAANPDGSAKKSHFNAHKVDLNRNWPTKDWQPQAVHPPHGVVSGGNQPLSEPETKALYEFLRNLNPDFAISLHSQASIVESNHVGQADTLVGIYAKYSGYKEIPKWPYYEVRGQFIDAMADLGIAAADVELSNHKDTDFERNLKALKAVMDAASGLHSV